MGSYCGSCIVRNRSVRPSYHTEPRIVMNGILERTFEYRKQWTSMKDIDLPFEWKDMITTITIKYVHDGTDISIILARSTIIVM